MMKLPNKLVRNCDNSDEEPSFSESPLQLGMREDAWRVTVASVLLCRARRQQAEGVLRELLSRWPTASHLAVAEGMEEVLRPVGLHRNRARQLQRLSSLWNTEAWGDLRDLPGVGLYVADAVGLFCFGDTNLESTDRVLRSYADVRLRKVRQGSGPEGSAPSGD